MISILNKNFTMAVLAVAGLINASTGWADGPFAGALGPGNANFAPTDVYRLTCPAGTASVRARVNNPNGNPVDEITVQIIAPSGAVRSAISLEGVAPPTAILSGVAGRYLVTVHKDSTLLGANFSISLDCYTAAGSAIPGIQTVRIQNQ